MLKQNKYLSSLLNGIHKYSNISILEYSNTRILKTSITQMLTYPNVRIPEYSKHIAYILIIILITACANPMPPTGGPPDKTPPVIENVEPANKTLNFHGESIVIEFNKYMNRTTVNENISVSPTKKIKPDWSGKELEIIFQEPLDSNTTYSISLGADFTDMYSNKPETAFSIVFSTGNYLDSGMIKGMLYDKSPSGAYIFVYPLDSINPDTLNPYHTKPKYKTQVGTSGQFEIQALKYGKYRLMALRDKYKEELYKDGVDDFGAASQDYIVSKDSSSPVQIRLGPTVDNEGPLLFSVEAVNRNLIQASFSEDILPESIHASSFLIQDSIDKKGVSIISAFRDTKSAKKLNIILSWPLDTARKFELIALTDSVFSVRDSSMNRVQDTSSKRYFKASAVPDTITPTFIYRPFKDSTKEVNPWQQLEFVVNTVLNKATIENGTKMIKSFVNEDVPIYFDWKADNHFVLHLGTKVPNELLMDSKVHIDTNQLDKVENSKIQENIGFLDNTWYKIIFQKDSIIGLNGVVCKDSSVNLNFRSVDTRTFGSVSGKIVDSLGLVKGPFDVWLISKDGRVKFKTITDEAGKWKFPSVPALTYTFDVYLDKNRNGFYDYGNPYPFRYSEEFFNIKKEITIKSRWEQENVELRIR